MSKFNKPAKPHSKIVAPIVSAQTATTRTHNHAPGFVRDVKSELFLLAVSNLVGQDTFYEKGKVRDARFSQLIREAAAADPDWTARFLPWLRSEANMRSASLVGAVEAARAMVGNKVPGSRAMVASVLQRADEPGEMLGYFTGTYGRNIPKPIKRGIADAVGRLYNEYGLLKYDTASHGFRFGDVIELTHPAPATLDQGHLFKFAIDRRHGHGGMDLAPLPMVRANADLRDEVAAGVTSGLLNTDRLRAAGFTWEDALSLGGKHLEKAKLWEALIPTMGYMARLRNLRNFSEAGISEGMAQFVIRRMVDPIQVAKSRQFPFRFLSAYRAAGSDLRWGYPLQQALDLSLQNVPSLPGRTLILVDQSPSMFPGFYFSTKNTSDITLADQAKVFGTALALRAEHADLVQFGNTSQVVKFTKGESTLKVMERFTMIEGTNIGAAVQKWYSNHDRVIILTDEQTSPFMGHRDPGSLIPLNKLMLTFNVAGYKAGHTGSGTDTRVTVGGLTDKAFQLVPMLEARAQGGWPF